MGISLKGMTWDHPRGVDPLLACSALWQDQHGVEVQWERRSLQDFESFPVEELARQYDLIVIDHPHVGQVTRQSCLLPFPPERTAEIAAGSVGASFASYHWQGQQWALPIDAATQVLAWRADRLPRAPASWDEVMELARAGRLALPLRAPHSLMCLYTLCAQLGAAGAVNGPQLFEVETAAQVCRQLSTLVGLLGAGCFEDDPIAVFNRMAQRDAAIDCVPLIYGYVNYALAGFAPARIRFADIPSLQGRAPVGSALGGTGLAVSAFSAHADAAMAFALWVAGANAQRGPYAAAGGQPGHAVAWEDEAVNAATQDFYRATRATLQGAWVRPRHDGYMAFQQAASERLNQGLRDGHDAVALVHALNRMFTESLAA